MNELQFPGLYIDDTANPHAILSFLCQSGYYCLILTDFLAEFGTKCGRVYCDYCDGTLISSGYRLCGNSSTLPMDGCVSP